MSSSVPRGRRAVRAGAVTAVLALGAACGPGAQTLDNAAKASLHDDVAAIRSATGNLAKAKAAVQKFRTDVDGLVKAGDLDSDDAKVLLAQMTQLEAGLTADSPPATVAPAPSPTAAPARPAADSEGGKKGKPDKGSKNKNKKKGARADR